MMLKLKLKNCSNHRSLPLYLPYLRPKKKIQRRLKESQNLILSMVTLFLVLIILPLVVSLS
jgi:hypothetical protein